MVYTLKSCHDVYCFKLNLNMSNVAIQIQEVI